MLGGGKKSRVRMKLNRRVIKPAEHKQESLQEPIGDLIPSKYYYVPASNVNGEPFKLNFSQGDRVLGGQPINRVRNTTERQLLSPTSGKIAGKERVIISGRVAYASDCLKIQADGKDQFMELGHIKEYHRCTQEEIFARLRTAAIYGMGGGGFPAWRKIAAGNIKHLIVNAVECEPYITADHALIDSHSDEIVTAISTLQGVIEKFQVNDDYQLETHIAMEDNMGSAIAKMKGSLEKTPLQHTGLRVLPSAYPSGSEKQLTQYLLGEEVPQGQVAVQQGILCLNVATIRSIYRTLVHHEPLTQRVVTISGPAVKQPRNYWIKVGTPIIEIMKHLKIDGKAQVFLGGGMMNHRVYDTKMPISSSSNCLLFFESLKEKATGNGKRKGRSSSKSNNGGGGGTPLFFHQRSGDAMPILTSPDTDHQECIRCGLCEQVCPVNLLPQELYRLVKADKWEAAEAESLQSCIECATCDYVCPSGIPLSKYYIYAKEHIKAERSARFRADRARDRFNDHQERITKQEEERKLARELRMAQMKQTNKDSPAEQLEAKERKIASLKIQISKTNQAIQKWQQNSGEDNAAKISALQDAVAKLEKELQDLTGGDVGAEVPGEKAQAEVASEK